MIGKRHVRNVKMVVGGKQRTACLLSLQLWWWRWWRGSVSA